MTANHISLTRIVESPFCVSIEDGAKVHALIAAYFDKGEAVTVSFAKVSRLTTAFLNSAIGQLYNEYDEKLIRQLINVTDASQEDLRLLQKVIQNAKLFFSDPNRHREAARDALGDEV